MSVQTRSRQTTPRATRQTTGRAAGNTTGRATRQTTRHVDLGIEHEGRRYRYRILGRGCRQYAPTVMLGGAFQTMKSLQWFAEALALRTSVLLTDLPGSGDSDPLPPEVGADYLAQCVIRILDRHGIRRINLIGVSFGSAIAYAVAQAHPDRVDDLVLIGTMSEVDARMRRGLEVSLQALGDGDLTRFADRVSHVLLNHDRRSDIRDFDRTERLLRRSVERMTARQIEQFRSNSERLLHHRRLDLRHPPTARTLVCTGEHDPLTTPWQCLRVVERLPRAELALIESADHLAPLQRLDVCVHLVDSFLRGLPLQNLRGCVDSGSMTRLRSPRRPRRSHHVVSSSPERERICDRSNPSSLPLGSPSWLGSPGLASLAGHRLHRLHRLHRPDRPHRNGRARTLSSARTSSGPPTAATSS